METMNSDPMDDRPPIIVVGVVVVVVVVVTGSVTLKSVQEHTRCAIGGDVLVTQDDRSTTKQSCLSIILHSGSYPPP